MATVTKRQKRFGLRGFPVNQVLEEEGTLEAAVDQAASRPRRSLWKWLLAGVAVLIVVLWLLPAIVAHTPLLSSLLGSVAADLNGTLTARSATLSWFAPAKLSGLDVRDEQGQTVLEIPEVRTERSLWALLRDSSDLGRIRVERPTLSLVLREDGSNVEDVLASYLTPREEKPAAPGLVLEIVDGKLSIGDPRAPGTDAKRWSTWQVEAFQLTLNVPANGAGPLELQTSGT
ncbi:MAG: hypothetical protein ABIP48_10440, partial [Planctomycetota bacterium]